MTKAFDIHKRNNFEFGILEVSNRLGILYGRQNNLPLAESYLQQSLTLSRKRGDHEHVVKNLENLGSLEIARSNYNRAERYLLEAYPVAEKYGYKKWFRDIANDLYQLYTIRKDNNAAFFYFKNYVQIRDSIFNEAKAMQFANLRIEQETKDKEFALQLRKREIQFLQEQSRFDKWIRYFLMGSIVLLIAIAYFIFMNQRLRIRKKQEHLQNSKALWDSQQLLAKAEIENARLKELELRKEIEFKNKELTSYTMNFIYKNELFNEIREKLEHLKKGANQEVARDVSGLLRLIQSNQNIDKEWEDFKKTFENVHHNFFGRLLYRCPDLSPTELKHCALIKLNLSMKETASMLGISPDSVKTSRYRLRKKLNLEQEQTLTDFIMSVTDQQAILS